MTKKGFILLSFTALFFGFSSFSQEKEIGTEVVNIVKPYTPTISDAFKVKETPELSDSTVTQKKEVQYTIFSVPVASTFTPAKGKATTIAKPKREKLYDNYATLGFGNYTTILGELYSNFEISRTDNASVFFRHNSSQGGIKGVELDDKYYNTSLDANYTSRQRNTTYRLEAGAEHELYNWYGVPQIHLPHALLQSIDPTQTYFGGYVGGSIAMDNSFMERTNLNLRYLGDAFSSSEFSAKLTPEFSFPLENVQFKIDGDIDYLNGSFKSDFENNGDLKYSFLNVGVAPSISFATNEVSITLGVAGYLGLDSENSNTDFSLYPRINASYRLLDDNAIVYGGVDGGLQQNSYYGFKEVNPFISPTLYIVPTKNIFDAFGGIKGKLTNVVAYNLKASYGKEENKPLFMANRRKSTGVEAYEYWNSFNVVYDDVNTLEIFGELKTEFSDMLMLGVNVSYFNYNTGYQFKAWNLPNLQATVFSNFNITDELYGGASVFFVGERKDLVHSFVGTPGGAVSDEVTLKSYLDANLHLGYRFTDRLAAFIKGNNLLGVNYQKWMDYPVQGIQALIGATYKFDW